MLIIMNIIIRRYGSVRGGADIEVQVLFEYKGSFLCDYFVCIGQKLNHNCIILSMKNFSCKEPAEASLILANELKNQYIPVLTHANAMVEWRTIDYPPSSPICCTTILDNTVLSIRLSVSYWLSPKRFPTWNPISSHGFAESLVQKKKTARIWSSSVPLSNTEYLLQNDMVVVETIHLFRCSNEWWIAIEGISPS